MAKLTTKSHKCSVEYVDGYGTPTGTHCPAPAYRRLNGKWLCRKHMAAAKARAAQVQAELDQMFTVVHEIPGG
jgi:hypothetical protein